MTAFPSLKRQAFNGLCLAIVRARPGTAGELRLTASGANLSPAFISISVLNP
jgi:beta-galactosidase